jgi:hypothetical protein
MNKGIVFIFLLMSIVISCENEDSCKDLIDGIYQFPELPENHNMTQSEITKFFDLPKDICNCILTDGLIETCLNYPNLKLVLAGSNIQSGYNLLVKERFRGIRELESRSNRGTFLLHKFQTIDPLGYNPNWDSIEIGSYSLQIIYFEIIISQYVILDILTKDEKISLMEKAIEIYEKTETEIETLSYFSLECIATLMGRLMYLDNYEDLISVYNEDFLIKELVDYYGPVNIQTVEIIYNLSKEYLNNLKNN